MPHRFPALIADPPRGEGRLWLTGGRLFDGTGARLLSATGLVPLSWLMIGQWARVPAQ